MLTNLSIKNYALIETLEVSFDSGFITITGETGAGKSILLGALSLVLGKRADLSALRNKEAKCVIEADFNIKNYNLNSFFKENDLDFEPLTILRREILPSGKSRAFINDTPVTLNVLANLGESLVDIHSQHQTLQLAENDFQLKVIDAIANNQNLLSTYSTELTEHKSVVKDLQQLIDYKSQANKELEYNSFLLKELQDAKLKVGMLEELEQEYEQLNNVETILENLQKASQTLNTEDIGVLSQLQIIKQSLGKLSGFSKEFEGLYQRIESVTIELDDVLSELEQISDRVEANPKRFEEVNTQLQLLHNLFKKHQTDSVEQLEEIRDDLEVKVDVSLNIDAKIEAKEKELQHIENSLNTKAKEIHQNRKKIIPTLKQDLEEKLALLGMPSSSFKIELAHVKDFKSTGKDELSFLFSANKGSNFGELKKVASGGELSRIMLVIKSILAKFEKLPTLMFDEIDTGVSGEISSKMGSIMKQMGANMQVYSITHLPQVAAQGSSQYKVFKQENTEATFTHMKKLKLEERIVELSEMLGGKNPASSAVAHAKELLGV